MGSLTINVLWFSVNNYENTPSGTRINSDRIYIHQGIYLKKEAGYFIAAAATWTTYTCTTFLSYLGLLN